MITPVWLETKNVGYIDLECMKLAGSFPEMFLRVKTTSNLCDKRRFSKTQKIYSKYFLLVKIPLP